MGGGVPVELQTLALSSLNLIMYSHKNLLSKEELGSMCHQMAHWLRNASTVSAPNPFQRQIFGGSKSKGYQSVAEIDGTASRFFFTILTIAQYCFPDQVLNIYSFSMLRTWLMNTDVLQPTDNNIQSGVLLQHSPISTPRSLIDTSQPSRHSSPSQEPFETTATSLDNLSIGSQTSAGFYIPMSQSPDNQSGAQSPALGSSPDDRASLYSSGLERASTPLSFPLTLEESTERYAPPKRGHQKKLSRNISFTKLFPHTAQQGPLTGQEELREKAVEYCLRVLQQSERKPAKMQDAVLLEGSIVEAVHILDLLCQSDKSLVPKLIEIIRRLYGRITTDMSMGKWKRVMLPVVQFFLNHGEAVVFDAEPACKMLFGNFVSAYYFSAPFAFDVVMFCLNNMEKLCLSTSIFIKFFPNLLKILAWFPRTFLMEFLELLPVMMSEDSAVEVFHSLLDLPCLSAAMCTSWNARAKSSSDVPSTKLTSADSFLDSKYKPLFSFILRPEAGHGDTISKLVVLHELLADMVEHPRVMVSSQIVTPLLSTYFKVLMSEADCSIVSRLVPVILERSVLIYNVQNCDIHIRRILAEQLILIFQTYPSLIATHQPDITEFIAGMKNLGLDKQNFFINLVWSIGEYASASYYKGCTVPMIVQYFESLEALTYEIVMQSSPGKVPFTGKLISVLMTTLAKLASRCQDLVQRAILCCSKIVRTKPEMLTDPGCYQDLLIRSQELINLLKLPNVAPVVLNPQPDWVTGRWHSDRNASLPLLLQTTKVIVS
ncbi:AP-5 complex subunit zeta-1 isoform X2 [Nematostella vectensis]|nr:AP-5 complex subunit zeta-1 isoform X2 [Nematostella vectensis]XP_048576059.1 AP-5 complex subunit zeta-1 isoform X2 [Nematostella vectensis]